VEVDVPLQRVNIRKGIWRIASPNTLNEQNMNNEMMTVKSARTIFKFISYDEESDTSKVLCLPKTGRTHQLREHLRYLNHSIVNDDSVQKMKTFPSKHWEANRDFFDERNTHSSQMFIYLHAFQYEFEHYKFKCFPDWITKEEIEIVENLIK
jgi:23S rRNA-/tRNA-specific pseudouridylate synthase